LDYKLETILNPTPNLIYWAKVIVDRNTPDNQGMLNDNQYLSRKTCLENARSYTGYVTMTDPDGTTRYVKVLPVQSTEHPWREIVSDDKGNVLGWAYNLFLLGVTLA
jgi:hypothetical protein